MWHTQNKQNKDHEHGYINLIQKCELVWMSAQGRKLRKESEQKYE